MESERVLIGILILVVSNIVLMYKLHKQKKINEGEILQTTNYKPIKLRTRS